ncbi:diphthine--ammonia ligase [[Candida] jaroonii]|uniref:Diphthine--ammonia ligase n=1 Tax=[Candida] jaroonii TaxID=467808 RepID=A0ACA9Y198_9ASCO|nr:diphthine--ammonia ligase [[Candida] jaroonii]
MKFLALISGGKDSFHNIHHCLTQGHELVALGNLYPEEVDELDSFMFQTVGHDIIDYYSKCLDIPLYRQPIKGHSKNQDLEYSKTENDEIEDLDKLISTIISKHPDIQGVSCGAILSHYQRTRVENICDRYGLTSLAFLWQRDQRELMTEMCANELDARLIKVAAIGLESKHLGKSITEMLPTMIKLNQMYEVHICGEGGEFETIVLDSKFFKKRLNIVEQRVIEYSGDVSYLKFKVELEDKNMHYEPVENSSILEEEFEDIFGESLDSNFQYINEVENMEISIKPLISKISNNLYISNLTSDSSNIKDQLIDIFMNLEETLNDYNLTFNDIQHITLLLNDISKFAEINQIYESNFKGFLPPSRITIETNLPKNVQIQLSCKCIIKETTVKKGIHIRSRSYWAPQNIGPYSQARVEEQVNVNLATISGQIPLVPATMEFLEDTSAKDIVLSLQHFYRIKQLINVPDISYMIYFITDNISVPQVTNIWGNYCKLKENEDCLNRIVIVRVNKLPKNALVECGGETYRKFENYDDDDDEEVETEGLLSFLDKFNNKTIYDLKYYKQILIFSNSYEDVNELIQRKNIYVKITCNYENFRKLNHPFEFLPVKENFDYKGEKFNYFIVLTIQS